MNEPSGVRVTMPDGGCRNFLPGPSFPGVSRFYACRDATWAWVMAQEGAHCYPVAVYAAHAVRCYEPIP